MKRDSRPSGVLHVLLHRAGHRAPMTSEQLAKAMQTHPVVIRRILGGLRDAGFVNSEKGHGGGWTIAKPLADITMCDVYDAIGRSEEHTSELQSLMRISYADFCLKKKNYYISTAVNTIIT